MVIIYLNSEKAGLKLTQKTKITASSPIIPWEKVEKAADFIFLGHIKKQRHHFANKGAHIQSYGFTSSHV